MTTESDGTSTGEGTVGTTTLMPTTDDPTTPIPGTGSTSSGGDTSSGAGSTSGTNGEDTGGSSDSSTGGDSSGHASSSSTGGACEFFACEGECIDPETDVAYCGATACKGDDAGEFCSGSATCESGVCVESCVNCGFEAGDFTGWTVVDPIPEPFNSGVVLDGMLPVNVDPFGFGAVSATEGTYAAYNPFLTPTPGLLSFGQDLVLRDGATTLEFDYRIAWDLLNFGDAVQDRPFEVRIEPAGGGAPMETFLIDVAVAGQVGDSGPVSGSVNLAPFAGQTVFVNFVWSAPEGNTGPGQAELDNVRVLGEPW
jgi:hypothetical protein